jgi:ABC-2 type transport system ATP-binding protein
VCRAEPGISDVRLQGGRIWFTAEESAVAALSRTLVQAGALIRSLVPQTATLEDLFFSLTEDAEDSDGESEPEPAAEPTGEAGGG